MAFDRNMPYNDLPLLPPPGVELETKAVLKAAILARANLAELKLAGSSIPNQAVLIHTLGLQEAKFSSEIENIVTTHDALYQGMADIGDAATGPETKEVLRYKDALWAGYQAVCVEKTPLATRLFEDMFRIIKHSSAGVRRTAGTKLTGPDGAIVYTPPEGKSLLRDKLADLERFIHAEDDIDPLIKMAVMHYQFEAIHPFTDGNGRTGRLLNLLYLLEQKLLEIPILYLSGFIIEHKKEYYDRLRRVTEHGEWEDWILFMLSGINLSALRMHIRILRIRTLMSETKTRLINELPALARNDRLIDVLFSHPYCRIESLEKAHVAKYETASKYLRQMAAIGLLTPQKKGREIYYINEPFIRLLSRPFGE
jgi:Fic family protein